ncbi:MAG: hypothetical protein C0595_03115 [Marinilabiliales bacterium]|nr:MAG: hypothetical protein C0595_03115 [Marinilabiliales bacterium]
MSHLKVLRIANIVVGIFVILFLFSCDNNKRKTQKNIQKVEVSHSPFVIFATSGNISSQDNIRIEFSEDVELIKNGGDIINEDLIRFKPEIKGKLYWLGKSAIEFKPDKQLENGQTYTAKIDLGKLFNISEGQKSDFNFGFSVVPLRINLYTNQLHVYQKDNKQLNYLEGNIKFSDRIDLEEAKTVLTASQDNKELEIDYPEYMSENTLEFKITGINKYEKQSEVKLEWEGNKINSDDSGEAIIDVPAQGDFEYSGIRVVESPSQYVEISFSDPIDKSMDLNGIIKVDGIETLKYDIISNKVLVYPNTHQSGNAKVVINRELKNIGGVSLKENKVVEIHFGQLKPQIRFADDGVILPGKSKWLLTFDAVNLSKVDIIVHKIFANNVKQFMQVNNLDGNYQLNRVAKVVYSEQLELISNENQNTGNWETYELDLANLISNKESGIFRIQIKFKKEYALYDCKNAEVSRDGEYSYYQSGNYYNDEYYYPEGFHWEDKQNPCSISYYNYERFIQKNVIPTNIGLTVKGNSNVSYKLFAADLNTTKPINNLNISVFDYQQQLLQELKTDSDGYVEISRDIQPWLIIASRNNEYSYLKVADGSSLSYSRFDTKGVALKDGIKAFIYGDRDVWRPGDTLFLTMIINDDKEIPENHPASVKLFNPKSKLIGEQTISKNINGFYSFKLNTSTEDLTGVWIAKFRYGGSEFSKRIRIENLKPNRLKILLTFKDEILRKGNNKAELKVKWLHGGTAENLKTTVDASVKPMKTSFEEFPDYNFNDIGRYFSPDDVQVLNSEVDSKGDKKFNIEFPPYSRAPGELKVNFVTRVYEKGGDFSIDQTNMVYSPFDYYIGLETPQNETGSRYLEVDKEHKFKVATVDDEGRRIDVNNLIVEVYRISWSWWYGSGGSNASRYINKEYNNRVYQSTISTKNGEGEFKFKIDYPEWGRFYVNVYDPNNGHSTGSIIYMDWPSWYSRKNRKGAGEAGLVNLTANQEKYAVGDTVKVSLPTTPNSNMLISLESNDKILKYWWQETNSDESLIAFVATKDMAPNIYLYVSIIQSFGENVNDIPIRRYGLVPIMVYDETTILKPEIKMAESIRPNTDYKIEVSEKNNRKMTYTIAVVDEGLLDLTHFKTPDPHSSFYSKEALFVETWDIYDYVMSAYKGKIKNSFSIGGSDDISDNSPEKKKANRFKPVVSFIGPFTLEKGKTTSHKLLMQNYIGSVRAMLIAGNNGAYGHTDKTVSVKQPLMVLSTLPRVLAPGEMLKVPVSVFVMDENIKDVSVKVIPNEMFTCEKTSKNISVKKQGEIDLTFDVDVADVNGIGKLRFEVSSGKETAFYETEIQVRNPNPRVYDVNYLIVKPKETKEFKPEFKGQEGTYQFNMNIAKMPQINLNRRLNYLIRYPYGCVEQTTSSAFPQLFLNQLTNLSADKFKKVEYHINFAINKISRMQVAKGGFSYWQGNNISSDWGSSYAGHFLLMAQERSYLVSHTVLENWKKYQTQVSNNWRPVYKNNVVLMNDLEQAYRLFTLALAGKPNMGDMNRLKEMNGKSSVAIYELAAAYALAGQKDIALKLIDNVEYMAPEHSYWRYNYGSELRDKAMIVDALTYIDRDKAYPLVKEISESLASKSWYSTQSTSFALLAISNFYGDIDDDLPYSFKYKWDNENSDNISPDKAVFSKDLSVDKGNNISIENTGDKEIYICFTTSGISKLGKTHDEESNLKMTLVYKDMSGKIINADSLKQGTDFYAEVEVQNNSSFSYLDNMALSQIFPSGWEIINTRMFEIGSELKSSDVDYVDYRDDRVDFFFKLRYRDSKKYIVLLNAAYKGKYFIPSTLCSNMYNNDIKAVKGGGWISVY